MARGRKPAEKTKAMIAMENAGKKYETASEKYKASKSDADLKAANEAKAAFEAAEKAVKIERWIIGGADKVGKVCKAVQVFSVCANPAQFEFNSDDIAEAFGAMRAELDKAEKRFKIALETGDVAPTQTAFKFSRAA